MKKIEIKNRGECFESEMLRCCAERGVHEPNFLYQAAQKIDELMTGPCRFNCRTQKEAFIAGYWAGDAQEYWPNAEDAFKEWKRAQDDGE